MEELYGLRILLRYQSVKDMTDQIIQDIGSEYLRSDESKDSELILSTQWAKKLDKPARIDVECKLTYPGESTRIVRVDLSGLSNLETLERIRLSNAGFTSIDLSALSSLPNLVYLDLAYNELDELDLEPLAMSTSLQYLLVLGNIYESVNIEPIIHLPKLQRVSVGPAGAVLDYTRVLELWRSPKWTKKRKSKELSEQLTTRMSAAIKSFFLEMEKPEWLAAGSFGSRSPDLGQLVSQLGWKRILREWNELPSLTPVQMRKLLNLLEMSELFGFAGDSKDLFSVFPQEPISFEDSRNMIYTGIVDLLAQQIRETGNTQDLDIELMKDKQASVLVHDIIERRRHEVESITLFRKKGLVDVMPLMDTYYGRKILLAMELAPGSFGQGANLNSSDFQRVQAAMENLGLGLQVDEI